MTGPLEFVEAAHKQAEQTADRLQSELWWIGNAGRIEAYTASGGIQFDDIRVNGQTVTVTEAIQRGLLAGNPVDLLRRIAAERKILAEYEQADRYSRTTWGQSNADQARARTLAKVVRNLAEGWGWQEEQHA